MVTWNVCCWKNKVHKGVTRRTRTSPHVHNSLSQAQLHTECHRMSFRLFDVAAYCRLFQRHDSFAVEAIEQIFLTLLFEN